MDAEIKQQEEYANKLQTKVNDLKTECIALEQSNTELVESAKVRRALTQQTIEQSVAMLRKKEELVTAVAALESKRDALSTELSQLTAAMNDASTKRLDAEKVLENLKAQQDSITTDRIAKQEELAKREQLLEVREQTAKDYGDALVRKQGILESRERILIEQAKAQ